MIYARWTPWASRAGIREEAEPEPQHRRQVRRHGRHVARRAGGEAAGAAGARARGRRVEFDAVLRPTWAPRASSATARGASTTGWSRRGATGAPTPRSSGACASGAPPAAPEAARATSGSEGPGERAGRASAASRPTWPASASRSSCSSSRCRTQTPATPGLHVAALRSACAMASAIFQQVRRAPAALVLDNATERAGCRAGR